MKRYYTYKTYLNKRYGHPVYKVGVDAGFSCPNRDAERRGGCDYCDLLGSRAAYQRPKEALAARTGPPSEGFSSCECAGGYSSKVSEDAPSGFLKPAAEASKREKTWSINEAERFASIRGQIERGTAFVKKRYGVSRFSLYFQAFSNTFAPTAELKRIYDFALGQEDFTEMIISTRPDCITRKNRDLIAAYKGQLKDVWVELGLQSANDRTLRAIHRGHTADHLRTAFSLLHEAGIKTAFHVILGLPGEGTEEMDQTAEFIRDLHPEAVKIHNLHIPEGTRMYRAYRAGAITVPSTGRHLYQAARFISRIPGDIVVQRLVCDTPSHRLFAPKHFAKKGTFISLFDRYLEQTDVWQGKLCGWRRDEVGAPRKAADGESILPDNSPDEGIDEGIDR